MPGKIFINYRREDSRADAARIRDRLVAAFGAANVFMDVDNLMAGQRFDQELEKALVETDIFLAVMGSRWPQILYERSQAGGRDYVREEIAQALERGVTVIPVMIERAPLPPEDWLPNDLKALVLHQKHDVSHDRFGRDVEELVEAIKAVRKARGGGGTIKPRHLPDGMKRVAYASIAAVAALSGLYFLSTSQFLSSAPQALVQTPAATSEAKRQADEAERKRVADLVAEEIRRRDAEMAAANKKAEEEALQLKQARQQAEEERRKAETEGKRQADQVADEARRKAAADAERKKEETRQAQMSAKAAQKNTDDARLLALLPVLGAGLWEVQTVADVKTVPDPLGGPDGPPRRSRRLYCADQRAETEQNRRFVANWRATCTSLEFAESAGKLTVRRECPTKELPLNSIEQTVAGNYSSEFTRRDVTKFGSGQYVTTMTSAQTYRYLGQSCGGLQVGKMVDQPKH